MSVFQNRSGLLHRFKLNSSRSVHQFFRKCWVTRGKCGRPNLGKSRIFADIRAFKFAICNAYTFPDLNLLFVGNEAYSEWES